jgi:hypothetical protein
MAGEILDDPGRLTGDFVFWLDGIGRLRAGYAIESAQTESPQFIHA